MSPDCRVRDEEGQALVALALWLTVLATAVVALVDLGRLIGAKTQVQNAADAAALAAVSVKVGVHHTRELAYLAMTEQALRARMEFVEALAKMGDETAFARHLRRADAYIDRLERLQAGLVAYNAWIDQQGPAIVADAARLAYAANIRGLNSHVSGGGALDAQNVRALDGPGALRENSDQQRFIGAVNYPHEGLGNGKVAGKSFVETTARYQPLGSGFFGAARPAPLELPGWSSAGFVDAEALARAEPARFSPLAAGPFRIHWYSPRLVRSGQREDGSFGGPHAGGNIVSEH
ncbi:MAG: pilus assembly protein TadG-related protein [bacterium]|nr:pilus assembly protein TadG-related protein [bacterium]